MTLYTDANNFNGWAMSEALRYGRYENVIKPWDEKLTTRQILVGLVVLYMQTWITQIFRKIKHDFLHFFLILKKVDKEFFIDFMKNFEPHNFRPVEELICNWTEKN